MMRTLILIAAVILVLPVYGQEKAAQTYKDGQRTDQQQGNSPPISPQVVCGSVTVNQEAPEGKQNHTCNQPDGYLAAQAANTLVQTGLLIIGGISVLVAIFSAVAVWKQAAHIATSERAWVIAKMDKPAIIPGDLFAFAGIPGLINEGKTPAFIFEMGGMAEFLPKGRPLPEPPAEFKKETIFSYKGSGMPLAPSAGFGRPVVTKHQSTDKVISGDIVLWVYGYVKYRDAFSNREHETRYCFRLIVTNIRQLPDFDFVMDGPPAYNQAT